MPRETVLSGADHPGTRLAVISGGKNGYYIGFLTKDGEPYSRESVYFKSLDEAAEVARLLRY